MRFALTLLVVFAPAVALAQRPASSVDSALVARILVAEDRRDSASPALVEGASSADARIRLIATRAIQRIGDPKFALRDSFPHLVDPPKYYDPAWRLRYRALGTASSCGTLAGALADSAWAVRLRAADLAGAACGGDANLVSTLRAWVAAAPSSSARARGGVSWHAAAHGIVALARVSPSDARTALPRVSASPIPALRVYSARAAAVLVDTALLRRLAGDANANVQEAAIDALSKLVGHEGDREYTAALSSTGYQAVRAGARALRGSPRGGELVKDLIAAAKRLRRDSSESSRDARLAVLDRIGEFAGRASVTEIAGLSEDFDCAVSRAASSIATRLTSGITLQSSCVPIRTALPPDAVSLALGRSALIRVRLADSSGGGSFTVRVRGDVAPIMAGRILALAKSGYYDGLVWQRVEPDFVVQGGGLGANEYAGNPRFLRDELGTVPHARGTIGMSTRGHDTGDAQWFINLRDNLRLNPDYTVFGEVVDGMDIVDGILEGDVIAHMEVIQN